MPPSPEYSSDSQSLSFAAGPPGARTRDRAWRNISNAASDLSQRVSRYRCSHSSQQESTVGGISGLTNALTDSVALGIIAGLVVGKTVGIFGTTYILARFTRAVLDEGLSWIDVFGVAILAGIGFTVSLLIGDLAFGAGSLRDDHVKIGVPRRFCIGRSVGVDRASST